MARKKNAIHWKPILVALLSLVFIGGIIGAGARLLFFGRTFTIQDITIEGDDFSLSGYLEGLKGENIFRVDLKKVVDSLRHDVPQLDTIRVIRQPPHTLLFQLETRRPVAIIDLPRPLLVDDKGFVFSLTAGAHETNLPYISGLGAFSSRIKSGSLCSLRPLEASLVLLKAWEDRKGFLSRFFPPPWEGRITRVQTKTPGELSVVVDGKLLIYFGYEGIADKVKSLLLILDKFTIGLDAIEYIDLRYKEPVIKPRQESSEKNRRA